VFKYVTRPCPFLQSSEKAAPLSIAAAVLDQGREPRRKAFVKTGNGIGREILEITYVNHCLQHRTKRPDVGTVQMADFEKLDIFFVDMLDIRIRIGQHRVLQGVDRR